jgi:hypothetical protein
MEGKQQKKKIEKKEKERKKWRGVEGNRGRLS